MHFEIVYLATLALGMIISLQYASAWKRWRYDHVLARRVKSPMTLKIVKPYIIEVFAQLHISDILAYTCSALSAWSGIAQLIDRSIKV